MNPDKFGMQVIGLCLRFKINGLDNMVVALLYRASNSIFSYLIHYWRRRKTSLFLSWLPHAIFLFSKDSIIVCRHYKYHTLPNK
jgi:hypothetical protein